MTQYRNFIGEYEAIITYLRIYQYIQVYINNNQEILASLSTSVQESIYKEMIKDRAMVQALDGGYIIARLDILKLYIEQDLEAKVLIQQKELSKPKRPEKKTIFEDESWDEVLRQVNQLTHKLKIPSQPEPQPRNEVKESDKEVLNQLKALSEAVNPPRRNWKNNQEERLSQNNQPYRPRNPLPPFSSSYQPYIPAQMAPRPPLKYDYCKEEGHSATRCSHFSEDLDRRIFRTQGASYLFPNCQRAPTEGDESVKDIVRAFAKEKEELNKEFMDRKTLKPKPEEEVKPTEKKSEDKSTSIAHVEDWANWKPPTISSANDPFESHIGPRQTKQRMERQSQNQEPKKKAEIPGTCIEEEKEEERVIIPTKFQNSNLPKPDQSEEEIENIANKNAYEEIPKEEKKFSKPPKKKVETKLEIDKIIKKIMQQKINLTIEETLRMSPNFVHKLQESSEK
ncbi:hypothetical protein O181_072623 [Austropuccinia psidii MF-1]|uniref:Uncharacterized protein n=1 Tax=Austropuccinia psidii MF-1 TaxID=1389203 RepID=A0A9Q3F3C1_9BASI|nr:hypothetical protein [Austropuccinia psidii MF-1]